MTSLVQFNSALTLTTISRRRQLGDQYLTIYKGGISGNCWIRVTDCLSFVPASRTDQYKLCFCSVIASAILF